MFTAVTYKPFYYSTSVECLFNKTYNLALLRATHDHTLQTVNPFELLCILCARRVAFFI